MGMSKCYSLMKCMLIFLNIILLCVGVVALGGVGWAAYTGVGWEGTEEGAGAGARGEAAAARAGLAAAGAWAAALTGGAAAGLAGAATGSGFLLAGSLALQLASGAGAAGAGWWGARRGPALSAALHARLARAITLQYGRDSHATALIDTLQTELQCCGTESARDWQGSFWSQQQAALAAPPAPGAPAPAPAPAPEARSDTLDLSVSAPAPYYYVPASCCVAGLAEAECVSARRVALASGGGARLHAAGCARRAEAALRGLLGAPRAAAAALLAAQLLAALLAAAACLAHPPPRYKA
ncbi:hypothetical protein JYU34_017104 [Plutella xylostella]|uniref:Tetraspanin n=1 Tax=Plutella xylostella TaxID=51655 RepID=A0ABQ7Q0D6_PLUXY|nr:hypothetical protein JYU34_017104 [Plutella xylostella]